VVNFVTFYILDPNLAHGHGHQIEWDLSIAAAARRRGENAIILAHKDFARRSENGISILPHFSHTTYESRSTDKFASGYDDFRFFNKVLEAELSALQREAFGPNDTILAPTLSERHLLGYVSWMKSFEIGKAPLFVVHLMFPSGLAVGVDGHEKIIDPLRTLFYSLAFRRAAEAGPKIFFFGGGRQIAREYSVLKSEPISSYAIPLCPEPRPSAQTGSRLSALLYAGDMKIDKGIGLLPGLADRLCREHADWGFLVHVNAGIGGAQALRSYDTLGALSARHKNLDFRAGRLERDAYLDLLRSADCMISTYDPRAYQGKSSGVLWECISLGIPLLVPAACWLAQEAHEWETGFRTYSPYDIEAICAAFGSMRSEIGALAAQSRSAAEKYRSCNGADALIEQIWRLQRHAPTEPPSAAMESKSSRPVGEAHPIFVQIGGALVSASDVKLAQYFAGERFRHLDISLLSAAWGSDNWPRVKFKFSLTSHGRALEFRQGSGWPIAFQEWPSAESDAYGPVLRIQDDETILDSISAWKKESDRKLIALIGALLPLAVSAALGRMETRLSPEDEKHWQVQAQAMSESLRAALPAVG
jgi:hypothetical protein